jgi:predicted AlkP superfamily phosphohydrolase/phosphomutase
MRTSSGIRVLAFLGVLGLIAAVLGLYAPSPASSQAKDLPRVVVLGFDGADHNVVERLMGEGKLPNLAKLAERGGHSKLAPSNPAQSPVSWASLTTGGNPGRTGIYDFLKRKLDDRDAGVGIEIGLARKAVRPTLPSWARPAIVCGAGAVGAVLGLLAALLLGLFDKRWRKGGRLQALLTLPAAILALVAFSALRWVPDETPYAINQRGGEPFWVTLDRAGVRCVALEAPIAFPADDMHHGACLSGLGTPDVRPSWGIFSVWTDDPRPPYPSKTETGGVVFFVEPGTDRFELTLAGPMDPLPDTEAQRQATRKAKEEELLRRQALDWSLARRRTSETKQELLNLSSRLLAKVDVRLDRGKSATLTTAEGFVVQLKPDEWSELVPVSFRRNPIVQLDARVRFLLADPGAPPDARGRVRPFELFVGAVELDAAAVPPNVQLTSPRSFAPELVEEIGQFDTLGWPEMTNPVKDDVLSDEHFLSHLKTIMRTRQERLYARLARDDWDCLFAVFGETDRLQHAFWRYVDPEWPGHDDESRAAMERFGPADHGFAPFRRGVNLNGFLRQAGFQVGGESVRQSVNNLGAAGADFFTDVDWSRTQAYAMGLGNIYLSLQGREPSGIVPPERSQEVLDAIRKALLELKDEDGTKVVREVYYGADLYHGARVGEAPDLVVGFEWGYRVSWQTSLGALDDGVIIDNTLNWSGDHCSVDPSLVPGILFSSRALTPPPDRLPEVRDVAATVLRRYGLSHDELDGRSFAE